ncbi:uncharacterized protein LOC115750021 isoform X3 [Rhodamnia argentea]|uniref:Uncharacterized protein LOC115750021 isoform X3 n=1 Tax=Rhodamnia argentea TaxID=178133 RepID=A0A8B8Q921_9MYRT|nr:uncharacterized protein LOC115750021 isoform X3 [Rhodamnia argentea]
MQSCRYLLAKRTRESGWESSEILSLYSKEGERPRSSFSRKQPPTAPKTISRSTGGAGSSSSTPEGAARHVQQSAPVNIPYWSKLQRQKSKNASNSKSTRDWDEEDEGESSDGGAMEGGERGESEEDEDEGDCKMPPHELIAMRLARSHISSFSVFEGAGRTLKGRDLSKVRNAVLTRTGFLESP